MKNLIKTLNFKENDPKHKIARQINGELWKVMEFTPRESIIFVEEEQTFITRKNSTNCFSKKKSQWFKDDTIKGNQETWLS